MESRLSRYRCGNIYCQWHNGRIKIITRSTAPAQDTHNQASSARPTPSDAPPLSAQVMLLGPGCIQLGMSDMQQRELINAFMALASKEGQPPGQLVLMITAQLQDYPDYGHYCQAVQVFHERLQQEVARRNWHTQCILDKHLPADVLSEQPSGTFFENQCQLANQGNKDPNTQMTLPQDVSHAFPIFAQIHHAAQQYPHPIKFTILVRQSSHRYHLMMMTQIQKIIPS